MTDKTGVLRTLERSHNTARLTAEEYPRSEILAEHSEATRVARDRVAELLECATQALAHIDAINPPNGPYWSGARNQEALRMAIEAMRID